MFLLLISFKHTLSTAFRQAILRSLDTYLIHVPKGTLLTPRKRHSVVKKVKT